MGESKAETRDRGLITFTHLLRLITNTCCSNEKNTNSKMGDDVNDDGADSNSLR